MINDYEATKPMTVDAVPVEASTETNGPVISTLNTLIEVCRDGEHGFEAAADGIDRADMKTLYYSISQERGEFASVLEEIVGSLGGSSEMDGSISISTRIGFMGLRAAIDAKNDEKILDECELGQDIARDAYATAGRRTLPPAIASIVAEQAHAIIAAHDRIKRIRDEDHHIVKAAASRL
jgi:uncharacterized protein (TIGR02284 family)